MHLMNNIKTYLRISIVLIMVIMGISCQEEIDIELNTPENQRIVVEGRITNELKNHRIRLTKTLSYFDNQSVPPLLGVEAYIREEGSGTRFDLTLADDSLGFYITDMVRGKVGENYTLVINDGDDKYEATAYLDTVAQMDSINYIYRYYSSYYMNQGFYILRMSAFEPPPSGNIYMFNFYLNDTLYNETLAETPYQNDLFFNNTYIYDVELAYIPQEEITLDTNTVVIEILSISKDEYNYNNSFIQETYAGGSVFMGPPANIPSNLKNTSGDLDGLGFFGASSVSRLEMLLFKEHNDSTNNPYYDMYF